MQERWDTENPREKEAEERRERSSVLSRFLHGTKQIDALQGESLEETFSDEEHKRSLIEHMTPEEFIELLSGINGILRGKKKEEWSMDGETVVLESAFWGVGYLPPPQKMKQELLEKVLSAAKEMNSDDRNLEDIALLVSSALGTIHPYLDGNGRTGRFIHMLLTKKFSEIHQNEFEEVLGRFGREKIISDPGLMDVEMYDLLEEEIGVVNPSINTERITNLFGWEPQATFAEDISEQDQNHFFKLWDEDNTNLFLAVFQYIQNRPDKDIFLKKFPNRSAIPIEKLSKNLKAADLDEVFRNYEDLKKRYVEIMIDSFVRPNDYLVKPKYELRTFENYFKSRKKKGYIPLLAYYKSRIKEKAERIAEEEQKQK